MSCLAASGGERDRSAGCGGVRTLGMIMGGPSQGGTLTFAGPGRADLVAPCSHAGDFNAVVTFTHGSTIGSRPCSEHMAS